MIERLAELLGLADADYWSDVGCVEARAIIDADPQLVMCHIKNQWSSWPEPRQEHLAYILGEGTHPLERDILLEMASSSAPGVAMSAR
jgi:hypothetical protein